MEKGQSYYQILGVDSSADADAIKAAYRDLARKFHPDIHPNKAVAEQRFKQIGEAYNILSDPQKKATYDIAHGFLKPTKPSVKTPPKKDTPENKNTTPKTAASSDKNIRKKPPPRTKVNSGQGQSTAHVDLSGTGFKDMFDSLFRKGDTKKEAPKRPKPPPQQTVPPPPKPNTQSQTSKEKAQRGEDITVDMMISRDEAQEGIIKSVQVHHTELCRRCSGTGKVNGIICSICQGEKQILTVRKIDVRIPAGVKGGSKVRVAKEGKRGAAGGEPGDLFLLVKIEEEQFLKIDGMNVSCELPITITQAVLGTELDVSTIHGKVKMVIPPLTNSGMTFRLKGQGVTLNGITGDQFVTVQIMTPKTLSSREKELYEELARMEHK